MTHPSRIRTLLLAATVTPLLLAGCASTGDPREDSIRNEEMAGQIIGGIIGGVVGRQFGDGRGRTAMTVLGATAGAMIGGNIARNRAVSRWEQEAAYRAFEHTPSGQPVEWRDPDSRNYGSYTPQRTYRTTQGTYCREYSQFVVIDGREERAYGTACRQPDGTWQIRN